MLILMFLIVLCLFVIGVELERIRIHLTGADEYGEKPRAQWKDGKWNGVKDP